MSKPEVERKAASQDNLKGLIRQELARLLECEVGDIQDGALFSRYGVDSLRAVRLCVRLSEVLGRKVSPALLWAYSSVASLAKHLFEDHDPSTIEPLRRPRSTMMSGAREPVAVVGIACRFPIANDPAEFWELLSSGRDSVGVVPSHRWDPKGFVSADPTAPGRMLTEKAAFLRQRLDAFDPLFFGVSPREAEEMDPHQRLFLEVAWEALEDAGCPVEALDGSRTSVFAAAIWNDYAELASPHLNETGAHSATGRARNMIANRLSYALGLRGPSVTIDSACSASLYAVHLACQSLWLGESDMAIVGGVNLLLNPGTSVALSKFGGLSPDGRCKPFDARANGYGRGEGCGVVVLKPLRRALADGDRVWCQIRGSAANNDGRSNGLTAPNLVAQEEVLREAYERAGIDPSEVAFVETHGTGTALGDPIEATALGSVFRGRALGQPLVLGAVKSNIGHLEGAAGIAGFIKAALVLRHRSIPPNAGFREPNPHIDFEGLGLRVPTAAEPWPDGSPAFAGVSSFGWGGTNVHVVMEGCAPLAPSQVSLSCSLPADDESTRASTAVPQVVFVCSPHGQQWPGMGREMFRAEPVFRDMVQRCDAALAPHTGWSIAEALFGAAEGLDDVDVAQPLLFALQLGLAAWLEAAGVRPAAAVGTCFSEITAAVIAGVLDLADGALLVHHYARAQKRMAGVGGGMAVVGLPREEIAELAEVKAGSLEIAGIYGPRSTALAGQAEELGRLLASLKARDVLCGMVRIDVAVHSVAMDAVVEELMRDAASVTPRPGRIPLFSAATGGAVHWVGFDARHAAVSLRQPVRLTDAIAALSAEGLGPFVELSAHPVLSSALGRSVRSVPTMQRGADDRAGVMEALRELERAGLRSAERPRPAQLFTLSAASPEALRELAARVAERTSGQQLQDLALTAARRSALSHRLSVVARDTDDLTAALRGYIDGGEPAGFRVSRAPVIEVPTVAFVFPGQGSQWLGMGRELLASEPEFAASLRRCDAAIRAYAGWSVLDELMADEQSSQLDRIDVVQPLLFSMGVALAALWRHWGVRPDAVIGHSMGEVAAAHVAGILTLEDAVRIICGRSALLRTVSGQGAMLAAELTLDEAQRLVAGREQHISVAVNNSPRSSVLSGDTAVLSEVAAHLAAAGVFHRWVKVDVASHSPQMDPLRGQLLESLRPLTPRRGSTPLYSTVSAEVLTGETMDAAYWVRNLREPVLFSGQIAQLLRSGIRCLIEMSPHPVLVPAIEQVVASVGADADRPVEALASLRRGEPERATLLDAIGALFTLGGAAPAERVNPPGLRGAPLPSYPWQRERHWPDHLTFSAPSAALPPKPAPAQEPRSAKPSAERHRRDEPMVERVRRHVARVAKVDPRHITDHLPLLTLGINSVMSLELRNRLERELGVSLSATVIWNYPTIADLAAYLGSRTSDVAEPGSTGGRQHDGPDLGGFRASEPEAHEFLRTALADLSTRLENL